MQLSDKMIKKFQILYKEHFGIEISKKEAYEKGIKLVQLMKLIYKPIKKSDFEKLK